MTVKVNVAAGAMVGPDGKLAPITADTGPQGLSAYQVWLAAGNTGSQADYLASLRSITAGPEGDDGWTPTLAGELDGTRTLIRVVDWTGGQGTKPNTGMYLGTTGYVTAKADAFNFNASKRVLIFSAATNAQGIATIDLSTAKFANIPVAIPLPATTAILSGPTRSTVVANSLTKTSVQIKIEQQAIVTGIVSVLVGATANVLVIEV